MRTTKLNLALASLVLSGFAGCAGSSPPAAPPETAAEPEPATSAPAPVEAAPTAEPETAPADAQPEEEQAQVDVPPEGSSLNRIMQAHFVDALLIRKAVIAGRPEDTSRPANAIVDIRDLDNLPKGWRPFVEHMQETAGRITNSTTPSAAAAAAADLGVSCGLCHQRNGGPKPSTEPEPPRGTTVESGMLHHIWATERLWDGLSVPSDTAWNAGAKALSSSDPFPKQFLKEGGVDVRSAAADFAKLTAKAPTKKTVPERAALYAELLVTCGTCHTAMKNKNKQ